MNFPVPDRVRQAAKAMFDDGRVQLDAFLVVNGVPFAEAKAMSSEHALAYVVAFAAVKGIEFDWDKLAWVQ